MLKNVKDAREIRETMLSLLPTCGTLAGIAIGLVGAINLRALGGAGTLADEILLFSSLGFLVNCYLIFFAMSTSDVTYRSRMLIAIDFVFLGSLSLVVFAGFVVVYELM
jgi:hypothetical protein